MSDGLWLGVALSAASVGALHSLAPDHWMPFAAVSRARGWSAGRTAAVTALCGLGHVTASVALGLLSLVVGLEVLEAFGRRLESVAGLLLIGFGLVYGLWGLRRAVVGRLHGHGHRHLYGSHHHDVHEHAHGHTREAGGDDPSRLTAWSLFLLFSADPCVAVIPILFAAASLGVARAVFVVVLYEIATVAAMVVLVLPARLGARAVRARWVDAWGDAVAGGVIVSVGLLVAGLGW